MTLIVSSKTAKVAPLTNGDLESGGRSHKGEKGGREGGKIERISEFQIFVHIPFEQKRKGLT